MARLVSYGFAESIVVFPSPAYVAHPTEIDNSVANITANECRYGDSADGGPQLVLITAITEVIRPISNSREFAATSQIACHTSAIHRKLFRDRKSVV